MILKAGKNQQKKQNNKDSLDMGRIQNQLEGSAKVYLDMLSPFIGYGEGIYEMSSLKLMTGTEIFYQMDKKTKKCDNKVFEECEMRLFLKNNSKGVRMHTLGAFECIKDKGKTQIQH